MRRSHQTQAEDTQIAMAEYDVKQPIVQIARPLIEPEFAAVVDVQVSPYQQAFLTWKSEYQRDEKGDFVPSQKAIARSERGCLDAFIGLSDAPNAQIVAFAKKWGVLGIWPSIRVEQRPSRKMEWTYEEPIIMWREVARRTKGILLLAALLSQMEEGIREENTEVQRREAWGTAVKLNELSDWFRARGYSDPSDYTRWALDIGLQRSLLERLVNEWLTQAWVSPQFRFQGRKSVDPCLSLDVNCSPRNWDIETLHRADQNWPEFKATIEYQAWDEIQNFEVRSPSSYKMIRLRPSRLFNVIVLELAATLTSQRGVYRCDVCSTPFRPEHDKRLSGTRRRFCSDKCREENNRQKSKLSQRKHRKKLA